MSNNPFSRHGITHLSASSLNLWRGAPGIWSLRYLAKVKDDGSPAMWRGSAVENGLAAILRGASGDAAAQASLTAFDLNCQGELSHEITAERELILPMLRQCQQWNPPSELNASQLKVEHWFPDIPIPVIGYLDFAFNGIDVDLKTTKACPSTPRPDHVRQVSLYRAARNRSGGLLYVTGKRSAYFDVTDDMVSGALSDLECDANSMMNFLGSFSNSRDAIKALPMDTSHYAFPKLKVPLSEVLLAG